MAAGDQQQAAQRRAVEGPSGAPEALTLEVDSDYYEALSEERDFDWERAARARTATRVHWAEGVMSPARRLGGAQDEGTTAWHGEDAAVEELEEYSSWQISLGIANERAALTSRVRISSSQPSARRLAYLARHTLHLLPPACCRLTFHLRVASQGQPTIDEFAPWQQRLGLQEAIKEQERAASNEGEATPLPRAATSDWLRSHDRGATPPQDFKAVPFGCGGFGSVDAWTPGGRSSAQSPSVGMPPSPRFSFRRRASTGSATTSGNGKKSILRERSRMVKPVASTASFASPRWAAQAQKDHMQVITNTALRSSRS